MTTSFLRSWLGNFSKGELKKFLFLGLIFFFTIGVYWFLRTSKDGVFNTLVGVDWIPFAKWVSVFFIIPLTMFYGALVDRFPKHRVFYALSTIYAAAALIFAYMLSHETLGIANAVESPWRLLGWAYYLYVESFGSIMVVLFWSFATDTTTPESAKRGFPILSLLAQFGMLLGSAVNSGRFGTFQVTTALFFCSFAIIMISAMIYIFMSVIPQDQLRSYSESSDKKSKKAGFMEGFRLIFSQPYLLGIFSSIMIFEIINTLFDFKFKALIGLEVQRFVVENGIAAEAVGVLKTQMFNEWVGWMGEWSAILSIVSIVFGIGNISRYLGLTASLVVLPVLLAGVALIVGGTKVLWVAGLAVIIAKGINYALYQPSKEQLYIPTSKDAKYKSKAFIEMFGSRSSKALASGINAIKVFMPMAFPIVSLGSSLILCAIWFMTSLYLGKTHKEAVDNNKVVC